MRRAWRTTFFALAVTGMLNGCRGPQTYRLASVSITAPAVWHEYTADGAAYKDALHLQRNGMPFLEKDSYISIYVPDENELNSAKSARLWQQHTEKNGSEGSVARHSERIVGTYTSWCVTGLNRNDWHVIDCAVQDMPLMFFFSGSNEAQADARSILRTLH